MEHFSEWSSLEILGCPSFGNLKKVKRFQLYADFYCPFVCSKNTQQEKAELVTPVVVSQNKAELEVTVEYQGAVKKPDVQEFGTNTSQGPTFQDANVGNSQPFLTSDKEVCTSPKPLTVEREMQTSQSLLDDLLQNLRKMDAPESDTKASSTNVDKGQISVKSLIPQKRARLSYPDETVPIHPIYTEAITFDFDDDSDKENFSSRQMQINSKDQGAARNSKRSRVVLRNLKIREEDYNNMVIKENSKEADSSKEDYDSSGSVFLLPSRGSAPRQGLSKKTSKPLHSKIRTGPPLTSSIRKRTVSCESEEMEFE